MTRRWPPGKRDATTNPASRFDVSVWRRQCHIDHQVIAVLRQNMAHVTQLRFLAAPFAKQPHLRIALRFVRFVPALLAMKAAPAIVVVVVLGAKALVRRPRTSISVPSTMQYVRQRRKARRT